MSSTKIIALLKRQDPQSFAGLACSTVNGWINQSGDKPKWSEKALKMAEYGHDQGQGNKGGQKGIFTQFPTVEKAVITCLNQLRDASVPLILVTIRGIVVALIMQLAPEIFDIKAADSSEF
ncbi:hypothetical protein F4604DRAFT_1682829 [Suillus subluteus]|nr:hypothetical protein F4604DRAFT_1682829 [Suillus subluteus]